MQAIIELFDWLKKLNYERIFVVSVVVSTLLGSLYLYLTDFLLADYREPEPVVGPDVAVRLAPIGRVVLAEAAASADDPSIQGAADAGASGEAVESGIAVSTSETSVEPVKEPVVDAVESTDPARAEPTSDRIVEDPVPAVDAGAADTTSVPVPEAEPAPASEPEPVLKSVSEPEPESVAEPVAESGSESGSETGSETGSEAAPATPETAEPSAPSPDIIAGQPASADGDGPADVAAPAPKPGVPAPGQPSPQVGYMPLPMPGQTYAPGYSPYGPQSGPQYPAPPLDPRQVPGAPSWYGPYQPYSAPQYQRPGAPAPVYPAPPGWVR